MAICPVRRVAVWRAALIFAQANPEIDVSFAGTSIVNGDTPSAAAGTDFGNVFVGDTLSRVFTISNIGETNVVLGGSPVVVLSGDSEFAATAQPSETTLDPGDSVTFQLTFTPTVDGVRTATVTIMSNDEDEGSYTFQLAGQGNGGVVLWRDCCLT